MMKLDEPNKTRILKLLKFAKDFTEQYADLDKPDVLFIITAYNNKFTQISRSIHSGNFDTDGFFDSIYDFDGVMDAWMDSLPFKITMKDNMGNSVYDVLFCVLQAINKIIEDYLFTVEEEKADDVEETSPA